MLVQAVHASRRLLAHADDGIAQARVPARLLLHAAAHGREQRLLLVVLRVGDQR